MAANKKQIEQRERFLAGYFSGDESMRGKLKEAARAAGYSEVSVRFKQGKLRAMIAEEEKQRGEQARAENPANVRSPISGKILPTWLASESEPQPSTPQPAESAQIEAEPEWWRDPTDGRYQKLFYDHEGKLKKEENFGRYVARPSKSFADSYVSHYVGLDGEIHAFGEKVTRPAWEPLDLSDLFAEEADGDPMGDPDALRQADLARDESLSQQIVLQMPKGVH
jgi:hypothetical protein